MKKVPLSEASFWIGDAFKEIKSKPHLRFGQALWNELAYSDYKPLMDSMCASKFDFFYKRDESEVISIFMEHYVDFES